MSYTGVTQDRRQTKGATEYGYGYAGLTTQTSPDGDSWIVRTPDGDLVSHVLDDSGGYGASVRYYLTDAQKSVIATVQGTKTNTASVGETRRYLYDPYGDQIRSWIDTTPATNSNNATNPPDGSEAPRGYAEQAEAKADTNPYRYASGYHDVETGWLKFGTRYYVPKMYRWTQTDPKSPEPERPMTQNPYLYGGCNPTNQVDPSGKDFLGCAGVIVGFTALIAFDVAGFIIFVASSFTPLGWAAFAAGTAFSTVFETYLQDSYSEEC